jgi:hypothetical protein
VRYWKPLIAKLCKKGKVTNKIQDLMATRFISKTQRGIQPTFAGTAEEIWIIYVMKIGGILISEVAQQCKVSHVPV